MYCGPPAADAKDEQRIDPDDRRDVAEGDGKVLEQVEDASQLLSVSELRKLGGVGVYRIWRRDHGVATHQPPPQSRTAQAAACGRKYRSAMRGSASGLLRR
jgi:hypothetical protein